MASKKFLVDIDLALNELQNAVMQTIPGVTAGADEPGRIVYDTLDDLLKYNNGTAWISLGTPTPNQTLTVSQGVASELDNIKLSISDGNQVTVTGANASHAGVMTITQVHNLNDTLRKGDAKTTVNAGNKLITESDMAGAGLGDVVGPNASVDDVIAVFSGDTGKVIKEGTKKISDLLTDPYTVISDSPTGEDFIQLGSVDTRGIKTSTAKIGDFIHKNGTIKLTADWLGNAFKAGFLAVRTDLVYTQSSDMIVRAGDQVASASQKMLTLQAYEGIVVDNYSSSSIALTVNGKGKFTGVVEGVTPTAIGHLATKGYVDGAVIPNTNYYLTGVSGSADGTAKFTREGLSDIDWDTTHSHSEYVPKNGSSTITGTLTVNNKVITSELASSSDLTVTAGSSDTGIILSAYNGVSISAPVVGHALALAGSLDMGAKQIKNIADGTANQDAVSKAQLLSAIEGVTGGVTYQTGYNAGMDLPPLESNSGAGIKKGWMYAVTDPGSFYGVDLEVGNTIIANIDTPDSASDWTMLHGDLDHASDTKAGIAVIAKQTDVDTGTDYTKIVTPKTLKSRLDAVIASSVKSVTALLIGPSSSKPVTHNLGKYPQVTCVYGGVEVVAKVTHTSVNACTITVNSGFVTGGTNMYITLTA